MLKEQARLFNRIAMLSDLVCVLLAFALAFHVRNLSGGLHDFVDYWWVLLIIIPVWYYLLLSFGLYASLRTRPTRAMLAAILKVHCVGALVTASFIYLIDPQGFSRVFFVFFVLFSFVFISLGKSAYKWLLSILRRKGFNYRSILIMGTNDKALRMIDLIEQHEVWGLRVVGLLCCDDEPSAPTVRNYNVLGSLDNILEICKFYTIDEVVFCLGNEKLPLIEGHLQDLEAMGITVRVVLDFYPTRAYRTELDYFHNELPIITYYAKPFRANQLFLKRIVDIIGALFGLVIIMLLFPLIALAIKLDSRGPLLFGQKRVGENGRIFTCWKFRSMYVDAEERKKDILHLNEMNGAIFKIKNDPRITRVGRFLRKSSLDELPQFWNVLNGEMSLVGTRPPTPDEVTKYENWHRKRICIKPGITGLWQVSGRNQVQDFDDVVRLDIEYIDKWTLWLDFKILLKTCYVVFARDGAS